MNNKEIADKAVNILTEKKAENVIVIDVAERSSFADYLILASGGSERQVNGLSVEVEKQLAQDGIMVKNIEGKSPSGWILMDYGDVIVNIFTVEQREKYNIEKMWKEVALDVELDDTSLDTDNQ